MPGKQTYRIVTPSDVFEVEGSSHSTRSGELTVVDNGEPVAVFAAGQWTGIVLKPDDEGATEPDAG